MKNLDKNIKEVVVIKIPRKLDKNFSKVLDEYRSSFYHLQQDKKNGYKILDNVNKLKEQDYLVKKGFECNLQYTHSNEDKVFEWEFKISYKVKDPVEVVKWAENVFTQKNKNILTISDFENHLLPHLKDHIPIIMAQKDENYHLTNQWLKKFFNDELLSPHSSNLGIFAKELGLTVTAVNYECKEVKRNNKYNLIIKWQDTLYTISKLASKAEHKDEVLPAGKEGVEDYVAERIKPLVVNSKRIELIIQFLRKIREDDVAEDEIGVLEKELVKKLFNIENSPEITKSVESFVRPIKHVIESIKSFYEDEGRQIEYLKKQQEKFNEQQQTILYQIEELIKLLNRQKIFTPSKVSIEMELSTSTTIYSNIPLLGMPSISIGDQIKLTIKSPIDGYLILFNIGTSGRIWQIIPNRDIPPEECKVKAERIYTIPGEIKVFKASNIEWREAGPPGIEKFIAIVTTQKQFTCLKNEFRPGLSGFSMKDYESITNIGYDIDFDLFPLLNSSKYEKLMQELQKYSPIAIGELEFYVRKELQR